MAENGEEKREPQGPRQLSLSDLKSGSAAENPRIPELVERRLREPPPIALEARVRRHGPPRQPRPRKRASVPPAPEAILAAGMAGLAGMLSWALVMFFAPFPTPYFAWLIGAGIGACAMTFNGRGFNMGMICSVLAAISIFGGRYLGMVLAYDQLLAADIDYVEMFLDEHTYQESLDEAATFQGVETDDDLRYFMYRYDYTEHLHYTDIPTVELEAFREDIAPVLDHIDRTQPDYGEWRALMLEETMLWLDMTPWDYFNYSFEFLDILFILLGLASAFWLGSRQEGPQDAAAAA